MGQATKGEPAFNGGELTPLPGRKFLLCSTVGPGIVKITGRFSDRSHFVLLIVFLLKKATSYLKGYKVEKNTAILIFFVLRRKNKCFDKS